MNSQSFTCLVCSSPEPEKARSRKRKQVPGEEDRALAEEAAEPTAADGKAPHDADDAFHAAAADLFRDWLAQHKAKLAEEEEVSVLPSTQAPHCMLGH